MPKSEKSANGEFGQAPACRGCFKWNLIGKKCWFYWDLKKICSQWEANPNQAAPEGPQQPLPKGVAPSKSGPLPPKPETFKPASE